MLKRTKYIAEKKCEILNGYYNIIGSRQERLPLSMSLVSRCIDNGSMEAFCGTLKC